MHQKGYAMQAESDIVVIMYIVVSVFSDTSYLFFITQWQVLQRLAWVCDCFNFQDGATPLFKACHKGHIEVVQELLKYRPSLSLLQVGVAYVVICNAAYFIVGKISDQCFGAGG